MWLQTIYESLFLHNKEASNTRMRKKNETESDWDCVQVTHASYTIDVPLNNFNIHQHNKEGIYLIGYQLYNLYNEWHQRWS